MCFKNIHLSSRTKTFIKFSIISPEGDSAFVPLERFFEHIGATTSHWSVAASPACSEVMFWSVKVIEVIMPFVFWDSGRTKSHVVYLCLIHEHLFGGTKSFNRNCALVCSKCNNFIVFITNLTLSFQSFFQSIKYFGRL